MADADDDILVETHEDPAFYESDNGTSAEQGTSGEPGTSAEQDTNDTKVVSSSTSWSNGLSTHPFGFDAKTSYDAAETLLKSRSESFLLKPPQKDDDIWKRPPPDFRPQRFAPKPPKRNSRDAMQPWKYGTIPGKKEVVKKTNVVHLPHILNPKKNDEKEFKTRFTDLMDAFDAKMEYVKEGMYKPGLYQMPKPHDFRGYPPIKSLGLDEFDVWYNKDPYNIHFLTRNLNIIHGLNSRPLSGSQHHGRQMAPPLTPKPHWEARLIMEKDAWPLKSASYTRYRRQGRDPRSALMSRIDHHLSAEWAKEQLERQLADTAK